MTKHTKGKTVPTGTKYVPVTPAGTLCTWLASTTKEKAIKKLLKDAAHMPYGTWENFEKRGYTIEVWKK
jgi:hypothetical protein